MIDIKCKTDETMLLTDMVPFQGNLKKRTVQDISELKESLEREGLLMPFAIWQYDDKNYLLDGHGRRQALLEMIDVDKEIINTEWPIVKIEAETEDDARKALLQITSQYGKITKQGVKQFCVSIPDYKAPAINKFVPKTVKKEVKLAEKPKAVKRVIKIRVDAERVNELLTIFKDFPYIEVL